MSAVVHRPTATAEERSTHAGTLGGMFLALGSRGDDAALRWYEDGRWTEMSYGELAARVRRVARGLIAAGIEAGDRVAILANTRPEWTLADGGVQCAGAATAPIYQTNSPEECAYVLRHSEARLVFCEDSEQRNKVEQVRSECSALERIVTLTGSGADSLDALCAAGDGVPEHEVDKRVAAVGAADLATLVYTSGTTGPPKACMLSHGNWTATMHMYEQELDLENPPVVTYLYLPLAHSLARIIQMVTLDVGGTIAFWRRDPQKILDDVREVSPTHFTSVPRVFEKIYTAANAGASEHSLERAVLRWAIATGRKVRRHERAGESINPLLYEAYHLADKLVLTKVRGLFGTRLRLAMSGAAPIAADVLEFFDAAGITVLEGWGLSETTAAGTFNTVHACKIGTIGRPLPDCEVRIADDGEILMRGPHVFRGYFKDQTATEAAFDGDWFRSGDMGSIDADGYVSITGRKKDIIITSSGKNVTPANIENALKESRWVSEAVVYGDDRPYLVAMITLDPDEVAALAEAAGVPAELRTMVDDERVREILESEIDAANERFARIEQIKRFRVLDHDLSQDAGELTPTLKVKRRVVTSRYADFFHGLYE